MAKPRSRDAQATRDRILSAAMEEFAKFGLAGARVDRIAVIADANKRMIYHYFGSKEQLFQSVLEEAYLQIRNAEQALNLDNVAPREALETLVRFTWQYYLDHPEFINLVNSANLHGGRHLHVSDKLNLASRRFVGMVDDILKRGADTGEFRDDVDPIQLNITIAAIGYYYLNNRYTGGKLFERDFMAKDQLDNRLAFNIDTILRLVASPK